MMKNTMMNQLSMVLQALNAVTVSGKNNLAYVSGSISLIEELMTALSDDAVTIERLGEESDS